jgi:hypothetical protein
MSDETHSDTPLVGAEAAPLHAAVDRLAAALHDYVETAVGVRAEFASAEADNDPRIQALETRVSRLNADLFDAFHDSLGMHPDLAGLIRTGEDAQDDHDLPEGLELADVFYLGFLVADPPPGADMTLDGLADLLDAAGEEVAGRFAAAGYEVVEWASSRGEAPEFDDDEFDDEFDNAG